MDYVVSLLLSVSCCRGSSFWLPCLRLHAFQTGLAVAIPGRHEVEVCHCSLLVLVPPLRVLAEEERGQEANSDKPPLSQILFKSSRDCNIITLRKNHLHMITKLQYNICDKGHIFCNDDPQNLNGLGIGDSSKWMLFWSGGISSHLKLVLESWCS